MAVIGSAAVVPLPCQPAPEDSMQSTAVVFCALLGLQGPAPAPAAAKAAPVSPTPPPRAELVRAAVEQLLPLQEHGEWPYEGVYRVQGEIPVGYRVGGTSIVATALLKAAPEHEGARAAIRRGAAAVLELLDHPSMAPSSRDAYDVRVWGHAYALAFLCELEAAGCLGPDDAAARQWRPKLVQVLAGEEIPGGGWNYANHRAPASFVTAPVVQALLLARSQGLEVPDGLFLRARRSLECARHGDGAFVYSDGADEPDGLGMSGAVTASLAGSAGRSAACESTLWLLGGSSLDRLRGSALQFFDHWDDLAARRGRPGTHEGPYGIAPYYFYYAHAHAAQAIECLPEGARAPLRERMLQALLATRAADGTWNDRVFPRTRNYGTSMAILALLEEKATLPARWTELQAPESGK